MIHFDTLEEYAEFFNKIPAEKWTTGRFENVDGQCCMLGHLGATASDHGAAVALLANHFFGVTCAQLNDGGTEYDPDLPPYSHLGSHPKERVLNYLTLKIAGLL